MVILNASRRILFLVFILFIILCAAVFDVLQYVLMRSGGGHLHCFHILRLIQNSFKRHTGTVLLYAHILSLQMLHQRYRAPTVRLIQ